MAVVNPPGFLQNAGATHTAKQTRDWLSILVGGSTGSATMLPRRGVHPNLGNKLQVTQTGSPSMAVLVRSGCAVIPGTEDANQGLYFVKNDADVTLSIAAAHATLNRIDIVVFKVEDSAYSGGVNASSLVVVTGTPASSPSAPSAPANSITLAQVSILANDTSITNSEITDDRRYLASVGGKFICTSGTRPASGTVVDGQEIYETDTDRSYITHDGGATWTDKTELYIVRNPTALPAASVVFTVPSTLREIRIKWRARCDNAVNVQTVLMRINGNSGANYSYINTQSNNATASGVPSSGTSSIAVGYTLGTTATAGTFGHGTIDLIGWDISGSLGAVYNSGALGSGGVGNFFTASGYGRFDVAGPYTTITLLPQAGNFVAGSDFLLIGTKA